MPELHFHIRWPDGSCERCYSPSRVVRDYFSPCGSYALTEFVERSRMALGIASARVKAKYGFTCSSAMDQLSRIERRAERFTPTATVTVESFEE